MAPNVGRYLYISTVSVYADYSITNYEDSPLATIADETVGEVSSRPIFAVLAITLTVFPTGRFARAKVARCSGPAPPVTRSR